MSGLDIIAQRSRPRLLIVDSEMRIVFADWTAMLTIMRVVEQPAGGISVLPEPLCGAVREVMQSWTPDGPAERVVEPMPDVVLRVSRLSGSSEALAAVICESRTRRDDLAHAARAFSLTKREREVLGLVLHGFRAGEIADELMIAETTVQDYFKQLLRKTKSRNRTEMIARVLGWKHGSRD